MTRLLNHVVAAWQDKLFKGHQMSIFNQMLYVNVCSAVVSTCGMPPLYACHMTCCIISTCPASLLRAAALLSHCLDHFITAHGHHDIEHIESSLGEKTSTSALP